jgi:hypothetical protein
MTKKMLEAEWTMELGTAMEAEAQAQALMMLGSDHAEFHRSFVEKRPPRSPEVDPWISDSPRTRRPSPNSVARSPPNTSLSLRTRARRKGPIRRGRRPETGYSGILGGALPTDVGGRAWSKVRVRARDGELGAVDNSWRGFVTVQGALVGLCLLDHGDDAPTPRAPAASRGGNAHLLRTH